MDEVLQQLAKYIDQIVTLLAVVVGGIITYITTSASEKRKEKRELKRNKLDEVLIPYCTCIEQLIPEIKKIYDFPVSIGADDFVFWLDRLNGPLEYLNAGKRVYLSKKLREELEQYKVRLDEFNRTLDDDYHTFQWEYNRYMVKIAGSFQSAPLSMEIDITYKKITEPRIKRMILSQRDISLKDDITEVSYVINDEPDYRKTSDLSIADELRTTLGAIQYGLDSEDDITDPMEKLSLDFIEHVDENTKDENKVINGILNKMQSNDALAGLSEYLDVMRRDLISEIDSITK